MRPYIIINTSMSADGKIATIERKQFKISGNDDFKRVDFLKSNVDAVMVGINTIISDDPSLTIKSNENIIYRINNNRTKHPIRIVVDSKAKININSKVLLKETGECIILVSKMADKEKIQSLKTNNHKVIVCGESIVNLKEGMEQLYNYGIKKILVEGGATLNFSLIKDNLVDEIYTFIGGIIIGGFQSPTLVDGIGFQMNEIIKLKLFDYKMIDNGILLKWKLTNKEE